MKKLLSIILTFIMLFAMTMPVTANGNSGNDPDFPGYMKVKVDNASDYFGETNSFTLESEAQLDVNGPLTVTLDENGEWVSWSLNSDDYAVGYVYVKASNTGELYGEYVPPITSGGPLYSVVHGDGYHAISHVTFYLIAPPEPEPEPSISLEKEVVQGPLEVGEVVTYTFTVTNDGEVDFDQVKIVDEMIHYEQMIGALVVGESKTVEASYEFEEADTYINTAWAYGYRDQEELASDEDDAVITINEVVVPELGIEIEKMAVEAESSSNEKTVWKINDTVWYKFVITNIGDTDLDIVSFSDPMLGIVDRDEGPIAAGASVEFWESYEALNKGDAITNRASVEGWEHIEAQESVTDTDTAEIDVVTNPDFSVVKTVDKEIIDVNEQVTYTIIIENTGDVPLYNVIIDDNLYDDIDDVLFNLEVGEQHEINYSVIKTLPGLYENVVTVTAYETYAADNDLIYEEVPAETSEPIIRDDDAEVTVISNPAIDLEKSVNPTEGHPGDTVTFTFTIQNTGDVPLGNVELTDPMFDDMQPMLLDNLAVGEIVTIDKAYLLTLDDVGELENVAVILAEEDVEDSVNEPVSDESSAIVMVTEQPFPGISIRKTVDDSSVETGEQVTYTFTVTNTGDFDFESVRFNDDLLGIVDRELGFMAVDDVVVFNESTSFSSEGTKVNTAVVYGYMYSDYEGAPQADASDSDNASVLVKDPSNPPPRRTVEFDLVLEVVGGGSFRISSQANYTGTYEEDTLVDVSFTADPGWVFDGFISGSDDGDITADDKIVMDEDKYIGIRFVEAIEPDFFDEPTPEALPDDPEEEIFEDIIPEALPQTSGIPFVAYGFIGTLMTGAGVYLRKRK